MWRSQIFENDWQGGLLLAVPAELAPQLHRTDLKWRSYKRPMSLRGGIILLLHGEGNGAEAKLSPPDQKAVCGQAVPMNLPPGKYFIESLEIEERPEGIHCCELVRWVPAE